MINLTSCLKNTNITKCNSYVLRSDEKIYFIRAKKITLFQDEWMESDATQSVETVRRFKCGKSHIRHPPSVGENRIVVVTLSAEKSTHGRRERPQSFKYRFVYSK